MELPLQITTRGFDLTAAIEEAVRKKAGKLDSLAERIVACRVVIERPPAHHHKGAPFNVHIDLTVPGAELVVKHEPARGYVRRPARRLRGGPAPVAGPLRPHPRPRPPRPATPARIAAPRPLTAAASAWSMSARMSSICSMPIDSLTISSLTPADANSAALSCRWVVLAG